MVKKRGSPLAEWRKAMRLSQDDLGARCATPIDGSLIGKYERGLVSPTVRTLSEITIALGVPGEGEHERLSRFFAGPGQHLTGEPRLIEAGTQGHEFIGLPVLESRVAAGSPLDQLDRFGNDEYVFRISFLQKVCGSVGNALLVRVDRGQFGTSMEDTIHAGSLLLVDRREVTKDTLVDRKIYVVRADLSDGGATIKRVVLVDSHLVCMSDNVQFKPFVLHPGPGERLSTLIVGRVAWWGTEDRLPQGVRRRS